MIHSQETRAFLAIFVQFPPATAKTEPGMWHHSISASPSGGNAATCIPPLQPQGLTTHCLELLGKWRKDFGNTQRKKKKCPNQNWLGFFFSAFYTIYVSRKFSASNIPGFVWQWFLPSFCSQEYPWGRTLWWCVWRAGNSLENPTGAWELVGPSSANHGNMRSHISTKSSGGGLS